MTQHNFSIGNLSRSLFRAETNTALQSLATLSSGTTAPSTTYAYQYWLDTSASPAVLKQRDAANSAWVTVTVCGDITQWRAYASNTEKMRLTSTGLGIGITSPAYALDVNGDINCTGSVRIGGVAIGTIADGSINYSKIQNVSANAMLMRGTTAGSIQEVILGEAQLPMRLVGGGISNVALGAGLSLSGSVLSATGANGTLIGYSIFTSSGTWTKSTNNPSFVIVEAVGGGGGGGGAASCDGSFTVSVGGGGGAGGYSRKRILSASLGATETVTVGAGGSNGSGTGGTGGSGGTSSFGTHCSASGGAGGNGSNANSNASISRDGGTGGIGSGGDLNLRGVHGGAGHAISIASLSISNSTSGYGGSGAFGSGGRPRIASTSGDAATANSGGGGSGAANKVSGNLTGGSGGSGLVIVWEYA